MKTLINSLLFILFTSFLFLLFPSDIRAVCWGTCSLSVSQSACTVGSSCTVNVGWEVQAAPGVIKIERDGTLLSGFPTSTSTGSVSNIEVVSPNTNTFKLIVDNEEKQSFAVIWVTPTPTPTSIPAPTSTPVPTVAATNTPTPTPTSNAIIRNCNESCGQSGQSCASGLTCKSTENVCRNTTYPDRIDCFSGTYKNCNESCNGSDQRCSSGFSCINNVCRSPSYPDRADCRAPSATPTPSKTPTLTPKVATTATKTPTPTASILGVQAKEPPQSPKSESQKESKSSILGSFSKQDSVQKVLLLLVGISFIGVGRAWFMSLKTPSTIKLKKLIEKMKEK